MLVVAVYPFHFFDTPHTPPHTRHLTPTPPHPPSHPSAMECFEYFGACANVNCHNLFCFVPHTCRDIRYLLICRSRIDIMGTSCWTLEVASFTSTSASCSPTARVETLTVRAASSGVYCGVRPLLSSTIQYSSMIVSLFCHSLVSIVVQCISFSSVFVIVSPFRSPFRSPWVAIYFLTFAVESAPFKLTAEFVDLMDGPSSACFKGFREVSVVYGCAIVAAL